MLPLIPIAILGATAGAVLIQNRVAKRKARKIVPLTPETSVERVAEKIKSVTPAVIIEMAQDKVLTLSMGALVAYLAWLGYPPLTIALVIVRNLLITVTITLIARQVLGDYKRGELILA